MILVWAAFTISTIFALHPTESWNKWEDVSKVIIMALLSSTLLTTEKRLNYFLLVIGLSLGFYGAKGGIFSVRSGGQDRVWGPASSIIADNNAIGLAMNMCLPILWYLARRESGYRKRVLQVMFFLAIPAIMFTYSRASALTLAAVLFMLVLKSRNPVPPLAAAMLAGILILPALPQKWWDRQQTVLTYERDRSAMSRVDNWKFCWRIAVDNPFTGVGFEYGTNEMFARYAPEFLQTYARGLNTHSIYFAMMASHGFTGFFLYFGMIGFTLLSCRRIRATARTHPDLDWITNYGHIVEVSLIAFLVNGAFVNMEYFDLPYHLVAVVASLKVICDRKLAESENVEIDSGTVALPTASPA
jgi:putative inorganic carbon (HCO3(-)) transporter